MQAVILCGGLGERLRPYTETAPKVMLELKGKPILEHVISYIKKHGISDFVLLCGYKGDYIEKYFKGGKKFGVKIRYSVETEKLGTAGAVNNAKDLINDDFIIVNGDVITDFALGGLMALFQKISKPIVTLVRPSNPYGVVETENGNNGAKIKRFVEKPRMGEWVNAGYTVIPKGLIGIFPEKGDIETTVYPKLVKDGKLHAYFLKDSCTWKSIDTHKDLKEVNTL